MFSKSYIYITHAKTDRKCIERDTCIYLKDEKIFDFWGILWNLIKISLKSCTT